MMDIHTRCYVGVGEEGGWEVEGVEGLGGSGSGSGRWGEECDEMCARIWGTIRRGSGKALGRFLEGSWDISWKVLERVWAASHNVFGRVFVNLSKRFLEDSWKILGRYLEDSWKVFKRFLCVAGGGSASPISDTLSDVSFWYTRTDSSNFEICSNHLSVASPRDSDRSVSPATSWEKKKWYYISTFSMSASFWHITKNVEKKWRGWMLPQTAYAVFRCIDSDIFLIFIFNECELAHFDGIWAGVVDSCNVWLHVGSLETRQPKNSMRWRDRKTYWCRPMVLL